MKISRVRSWRQAVPLSRPYTIAFMTTSEVEILFVEMRTEDGRIGLGSATPVEEITGESIEDCAAALDPDRLGEMFAGRDARALGTLVRLAGDRMATTPAARAAVDMALHDLFAHSLELPLVDLLGRCHEAIPTSITIGIKDLDESLAEADEYLGRGFRVLKVKTGVDYEGDVERLAKLRERVGERVAIRVDANLGYSLEQMAAFGPVMAKLAIEFAEQPVSVEDFGGLRRLSPDLRRLIAADESLQGERDAIDLACEPSPCGIYNIKLMKAGGITAGLNIARTAEAAGKALMWGCMDESVIGISAALHAAYASPATRYLDLDGSFDLARDPAAGGFELRDGALHTLDQPGLGVRLLP